MNAYSLRIPMAAITEFQTTELYLWDTEGLSTLLNYHLFDDNN